MPKVLCTNCEAENESTSKYCHVCGYRLPESAPAISEIHTVAKPNKIKHPQHNASQWKIIFGSVIGCVIGFGIFLGIQHFISTNPTVIDREMLATATEINKNAPIVVDNDTRLDNCVALPGKIFQYNYTLINTEKSAVNVEEFRQYLSDRLINFVKTSPQMKFARDRDVSVNYNYSDKNGEFILAIKITPQDYKE